MIDYTLTNSRLRYRLEAPVHVKRQIPVSGTINVLEKEELTPDNIIATGTQPVGFRTVRLSHELGTSPVNAARFLKVKIGQKMFQGELLADRASLFGLKKTVIKSPTDGIVDFYDSNRGELKIALPEKAIKIVSGMYGVVDQIDKQKGTVLIRTLATVIYGIIGSGREREGNLMVLESRNTLVSARQIPVGASHKILVGGALASVDALQKCVNLEIAGIITGGINAADFLSITGKSWNINSKKWSDVGVSIAATEGFGSIPIGRDIFPLFESHNGNFAILKGNEATLILPSIDQNSMINIRKSRLPLGLETDLNPRSPKLELKKGIRVRLLSGMLIGHQGEVVSLDQIPTLLPSGLQAYMVTVQTSTRTLKTPALNLEIIS